MPTLADILTILDRLYDPATKADWDAVGLVCGDPAQRVDRVLFAVDPVRQVVDEALDWRADLIVVHHPLFLRPVHSIAATTPKGRLVHTLVSNRIALHVCHTNADAAAPGVSDALAGAIGLTGPLRPIDPRPENPTTGIGRIGRLPRPESLGQFRQRVAAGLPETDIRISGDLTKPVQTVAVSGGAGDSYLDVVRREGVDVYLTADLRHHPASEFGEHDDAPALVDVSHWASEWPWLQDAADKLRAGLEAGPDTLETRVSAIRTDPWSQRSNE